MLYRFRKIDHGVILLKSSDRQLGLSTFLMNYCIENDCKLYAPGRVGRNIATDFYMQRKHIGADCPEPNSLLSRYIICSDISDLRSLSRDTYILLDNSCTPKDLGRVHDYGFKFRGFITSDDIKR